MGRYVLLWLLGVPIPILVLICVWWTALSDRDSEPTRPPAAGLIGFLRNACATRQKANAARLGRLMLLPILHRK